MRGFEPRRHLQFHNNTTMKGKALHEIATVRVGVEAILLHNNEIIMQRRSETLDFFPGYLSLLGGHVDIGESSMEAVIREVKEEADISIKPSQCKLAFHRIVHNHDTNIIWSIFGFKIELKEKVHPKSSEEGVCEWYLLNELRKKLVVPSNLYDIEKFFSDPNAITYEFGEIKDNKYSVKS